MLKKILDKIGSWVPGYKGYETRENRRTTDKILRESIAAQLAGIEAVINDKIKESINAKDKELMHALENQRKQVNTLTSQVKFAPYGASGFFAEKPLKEDELFMIYQMDMDLAESVKQFRDGVENAEVTRINEMTRSAKDFLAKRNDYINQYK